MANKQFKRTHAHIGRSEMLRLDTQAARADVPADKLLDTYISDVEWACHRHKLVGEALRGMHEMGVQLDDADITARPGDLAALHAVVSEFTLNPEAVGLGRHGGSADAGRNGGCGLWQFAGACRKNRIQRR